MLISFFKLYVGLFYCNTFQGWRFYTYMIAAMLLYYYLGGENWLAHALSLFWSFYIVQTFAWLMLNAFMTVEGSIRKKISIAVSVFLALTLLYHITYVLTSLIWVFCMGHEFLMVSQWVTIILLLGKVLYTAKSKSLKYELKIREEL